MRKSSITILAGLLLCVAPKLSGQDWEIPADQAAIASPTDYTLDNIKRGKDIYARNCKSCHGDPGKNNPLALVPMPADIASEKMQANTEGSLFYKMTVGKGVMPPFETTVSEGDRWNLVHFIMNFSPEREQLLVDAPPVKAKLLASVNEASGAVEILAEYEEGDGSFANLEATPVIISSKKAFGNIEIGQAVTNENGRAVFSIPEDVIGDEQGYLTIVVSLDENFETEEVALEKTIVGKAKEVPRLIKPEVLWSTNNNVSTWLLLSYIIATGGSWLVIGYVIFQIIKIKRYSKSS
jgi:mono/diheme cytochrome c family protein